MGTTLIVVLAIGFLFGAMVLMLTMGFLESERTRAARTLQRQPAAKMAATMTAIPGFFAAGPGTRQPPVVVFDDAFVSRLEHHVRLEQARIAPFVHHPSLDTFYGRPTSVTHVH